jgi:bis(5'-nucleosyl)-tetraphosphatase (symmetrical)
MSTYAIGDIQGCYREFAQMLEKISFREDRDQLWLVGDLVNRGPDSLEVLRLVKSLGDCVTTVLGNHDLHLLAVHAGATELNRNDTLDETLSAPDCDELMNWLRHRPLLHAGDNHILVHAGLLPQWTAERAASVAREAETMLRGRDYVEVLASMYGNKPASWDDGLIGYDRLRVIINALTRMRICTADGRMEFKFKGEQKDIPDGYMPWFQVSGRATTKQTVLFGHWSALGLRVEESYIALDSGCVWGRPLSAIRLEDRKLFQVPGAKSTSKHW